MCPVFVNNCFYVYKSTHDQTSKSQTWRVDRHFSCEVCKGPSTLPSGVLGLSSLQAQGVFFGFLSNSNIEQKQIKQSKYMVDLSWHLSAMQ